MTEQTLIISEPLTHVTLVSLNRPSVRNALNAEMMSALLEFWTNIASSNSTRCIVLTGTPPAFCAGADLKIRQGQSVMDWQQQHLATQYAMRAMVNCPIPIICAVNGAAFGGGLELCLAADFAYAAEDAIFSQSETRLGIMPGAMGTQHLAKACGIRRAKELTLTAEPFSAQQAKDWGIINLLYEADELLESTLQTAQIIASRAPIANRHAKKAINCAHTHHIDAGYDQELLLYNALLDTEDRIEGIDAFNEKRQPHFKGK